MTIWKELKKKINLKCHRLGNSPTDQLDLDPLAAFDEPGRIRIGAQNWAGEEEMADWQEQREWSRSQSRFPWFGWSGSF